MADKDIQIQINEINRKLDLVLEEVYSQKQARQTVEDLVTDVSLIGTDMFKASIVELDNAGIELDGEAVKQLLFKFIRNIGTINELFEMLESANDLMKDVSPIVRQIGLDSIHKLHEFEQKGYFEFIREMTHIADNVVKHFSIEDVKMLADNVVTILETVKSLTQPDMLRALNNGVNVYKNLDTQNIPEYSLWKAFKELNTPEMKKGLGFMVTFLKNIAKDNPTNK
jgi:uncharacterized protein YjgD (DUF1641 family)